MSSGSEVPPPGRRLIRTLRDRDETAKDISDTCLRCHAGREDHNNFRRSEHWRNGVGCTSYHTNAHQLVLREEGAPAPPGFHNLTQERIRNCTTCHTMIHGSNNHNFFFR